MRTVTAPRFDLSSPKGLHVALWAAQIILAIVFGIAGMLKLAEPIALLSERLGWPGEVAPALVRFVGACELAAGFGLMLPALTRVKPVLTPFTAASITVVMLVEAVLRIARGAPQTVPITLALGALAAFVAWGRFRKLPFPSR